MRGNLCYNHWMRGGAGGRDQALLHSNESQARELFGEIDKVFAFIPL